jgi:hypothetical protein
MSDDIETDTHHGPTPAIVARPEWLDDGLRSAIATFNLALEDRLPASIKAWMLATVCLRVQRAIYGSDLETAAAVRKVALDHVALEQAWEAERNK